MLAIPTPPPPALPPPPPPPRLLLPPPGVTAVEQAVDAILVFLFFPWLKRSCRSAGDKMLAGALLSFEWVFFAVNTQHACCLPTVFQLSCVLRHVRHDSRVLLRAFDTAATVCIGVRRRDSFSQSLKGCSVPFSSKEHTQTHTLK